MFHSPEFPPLAFITPVHVKSLPSKVRSASPSIVVALVHTATWLLSGVPVFETLPSPLPVPAPIKLLISAPVTPVANVGVPPPLNIPGSA